MRCSQPVTSDHGDLRIYGLTRNPYMQQVFRACVTLHIRRRVTRLLNPVRIILPLSIEPVREAFDDEDSVGY